VDVQVLLDFLKTMHTSKQTEAAYIKNHIELIDRDIQQVSLQSPTDCFTGSQRSLSGIKYMLWKDGAHGGGKRTPPSAVSFGPPHPRGRLLPTTCQ